MRALYLLKSACNYKHYKRRYLAFTRGAIFYQPPLLDLVPDASPLWLHSVRFGFKACKMVRHLRLSTFVVATYCGIRLGVYPAVGPQMVLSYGRYRALKGSKTAIVHPHKSTTDPTREHETFPQLSNQRHANAISSEQYYSLSCPQRHMI